MTDGEDRIQRMVEGRIWKVASGADGRDYRDLFLEHDFAAIGPQAPFRQRMLNASVGDLIVLAHGFELLQVGQIEEKPDLLPPDTDIQGWDLTTFCKVRWLAPITHRYHERKRFCRVGNNIALRSAIAAALASPATNWSREPLREIPRAPGSPLTDAQRHELASGRLQPLIERAKELHTDVVDDRRAPSEAEMVALYVVPLLLALGWEYDQLGLEWRPLKSRGRADVVAFASRRQEHDEIRLIVEAKEMWRGLHTGAPEQAREYSRELPGCVVVVTNGLDYYVVETDGRLGPRLSLRLPRFPDAYHFVKRVQPTK